MCGILGGNRKDWNYEDAIKCLRHRGPDAQRVERYSDFAFAFARLSIIDLSMKAMQPMTSVDKRYTIVFNGEIYDYQIIRGELEKKGCIFETDSDTEVLLHAFEVWGKELTNKIDGIFAFAVYDHIEQMLYLFRDRCGVKPLYYYYSGDDFAFASELKAIKRLGEDLHLTYDWTALYDYHTYLYIPDPKSMYKEVRKLPAATCLVYDIKKHRIQSIEKYWKIHVNTQEGKILSSKQLDETAHELRYHLENAVRRQIISDVPVGTFLSGGVDSTIITAAVKRVKETVCAYSIGFADKRYDELRYAQEAAKLLEVQLKNQQFSSQHLRDLEKSIVEIYDEPYADTSAYPTYFVSEFAKKDITVVLTGDGGDELFGGYERCLVCKDVLGSKKISNRKVSEWYIRYISGIGGLGEALGNVLKEDLAILAPLYWAGKKPDRSELRARYKIPKDYDDYWFYRKYYHRELPTYTRMRYLDFMTYLPGDILTKVDRASMAVSLEARVPFLDREVVEFAFSLAQNACNPNGELKGLLKHAYRDVIPKEFFNRRKQGFSVPYAYLRGTKSIQENLITNLWKL